MSKLQKDRERVEAALNEAVGLWGDRFCVGTARSLHGCKRPAILNWKTAVHFACFCTVQIANHTGGREKAGLGADFARWEK